MPIFTPALPLHATKLRVPAQVVKVYDGAIFHADARPWTGVTIRVSVRLEGIDIREMRGKRESEKRVAREAKAALEAFLGGGGEHGYTRPAQAWEVCGSRCLAGYCRRWA